MAHIPKNKKLKVLIVAAEVAPYASVGGMSRVIPQLARALRHKGHDIRIFMPKFGLIDEEKYHLEVVMKGLKVPTDYKQTNHLICNIKFHQTADSLPVYFLENQEYYEKRANVYGYSDDPRRWALLCRGALEFVRNSSWVPDIIHANDWQTGIIGNYLKTTYKNDEKLSSIVSVFTLHNLAHQGMFDHKNVSEMDSDDGRSEIAHFFSKRLNRLNFLKRGIIYSDIVNTVSEKYALEILTPEYGEGLDQLLLELRSKLFGIVNGIDVAEFDPETDPLIPENYNFQTTAKREINKLALQKEFGLPQGVNTPVLAYWGRLDAQKGLDLLFTIIWPLLTLYEGVQFVQVGGGSGNYAQTLKKLAQEFPKQVGVHPLPNFTLPRLIMSGADIVLFPSKFEPCGIVQMEAMRYGAVPVVRATGGLADTVENFNPKTNTGTGFVFQNYDKWEFFAQVVRALEVYNHQDIWREIVKRAMKEDFSWDRIAEKYEDLYAKGIKFAASDSPFI
ncbi:MAG: glycogen/starch synthase [bacterium]